MSHRDRGAETSTSPLPRYEDKNTQSCVCLVQNSCRTEYVVERREHIDIGSNAAHDVPSSNLHSSREHIHVKLLVIQTSKPMHVPVDKIAEMVATIGTVYARIALHA
jgi:hypothetical protein